MFQKKEKKRVGMRGIQGGNWVFPFVNIVCREFPPDLNKDVFFNVFKTQCQRIDADWIFSKGKPPQINKQANPFILGAVEECRDISIREPKLQGEDPLRQQNGRRDPSPRSGAVRSTVLISSQLRGHRDPQAEGAVPFGVKVCICSSMRKSLHSEVYSPHSQSNLLSIRSPASPAPNTPKAFPLYLECNPCFLWPGGQQVCALTTPLN